MKKILLILLILSCKNLIGQSIVVDTSNVTRPKVGGLYYQKKDKGLYIYRSSFELVNAKKESPTIKPDPTPTPTLTPTPSLTEQQIGYWDTQARILILYPIDGKYYLMQRDANGSYHVARGKNLLSDSRTVVNKSNLPAIESGDSGLGGLQKPSNFPESKFLALGFQLNAQGEYVKTGAPTPTPIPTPTGDKITIPVGLVMWDNWEYDYWNDPNPKYDYLINHISKNRLASSEYSDRFKTVPFWGQYHSPEKIKIRYNVRWSQSEGRNVYDEVEKFVTVKYDKTQADAEREVRYYKDAGFDWMVFCYYSDDSYLSENRKRFVAMQDKLGMKMTFIVKSSPSDAEVQYITDLMTKDYWFNIDGRAVLYLNNNDYKDVNRYKLLYRTKTGKDPFIVYYAFGGYPTDLQDLFSKMPQAVSAYNNSTSYGKKHSDLMRSEVESRDAFMGQYGHLFKLIPTLTTGLEELGLRTSLDDPSRPPMVEAATLDQLKAKTESIRDFAKKHGDKVPAVLWYAANEILESGNPIVPTKRKDGTIDTSVIDTIGAHQN